MTTSHSRESLGPPRGPTFQGIRTPIGFEAREDSHPSHGDRPSAVLVSKRGWIESLGPLVLAALGVAGAGAIVFATRWGPWVLSDSVEYLLSAESLASGEGLGFRAASGEFMPLVLHPPLYPMLLAGFSPFAASALDAARVLDISLFSLTVFLTGLLLLRLTRSEITAVSVSLLLLTSPLLVYLFSGAMSEPITFLLGTLGLLLTSRYIEERKQRYLWAAAIAFGGASLTRYPAVIYCLAGIGSVLILGGGPLVRRLRDASILAALGILPLGLWLAGSQGEFGALAQRTSGAGALSAWDSSRAARGAVVDTVWGWLPFRIIAPALGYRARLLALGAMAFFVVGTAGWSAMRARRATGTTGSLPPGLSASGVFCIFAVGYLIFLSVGHVLGMVMFRDIDERILSPLQPAVFVLVWCSLCLISYASARRKWIDGLSLVAAIAFAAANVAPMLDVVTKLNREGLGYSSPAWRNSPTIAAIDELPEGMIVVSDEGEAVQFLTGRGALEINELLRSQPLAEFTSFGSDTSDEPQRLFRDGRAALVLFRSAYWQFHAIYGDRAQDRLQAFTGGLRVFRDLPDGTIYLPPEGS